jgi:hypothetical protein
MPAAVASPRMKKKKEKTAKNEERLARWHGRYQGAFDRCYCTSTTAPRYLSAWGGNIDTLLVNVGTELVESFAVAIVVGR